MKNQSILVSIQEAVNAIKWKNPLLKEKALNICTAMFNRYIYDGDRFWQYKQFAQNYFTTITRSKKYYFIKDILIANGILDCDNQYFFNDKGAKGIAKGYRFNNEFFWQPISSTSQSFTYSTTQSSNKNSTISLYCPTEDTCYFNSPQTGFLQNYCLENLSKLTFTDEVDTKINDLAEIQARKLTLNENITDEFVYLKLGKEEIRYSLKKAMDLASETGLDLIQFKDNCYLDSPDNFILNKSRQLKISYCQSVFNIKNQLFYCGRNETNYRMDTNLTGLKKDLFNYLLFDGEKLVEQDIANAQFAIAAYLNPSIDENFIDNTRNGTLYLYTAKELNLSTQTGTDEELTKAGKALMFRIAFDKVKYENEFNQIRSLFPKYMNWVDTHKKKNGYKSFANLLQRKEAEIMIDGLLMHLIEKGYQLFTIHDALRVKESQANEIKAVVEEYFNAINFKCLVR